jgi:hypothetical protein
MLKKIDLENGYFSTPILFSLLFLLYALFCYVTNIQA